MPRVSIDFVIAGQPKSGTTALANFLSQHPSVCLSRPKEPEFFATDLMRESDAHYGRPRYLKIRTDEQYAECFAHATDGQLLGDASAIYVRSLEAARNIREHSPQAKVIISLRNPVDFIHSLHMQYVNSDVEDVADFDNALSLEEVRRAGRQLPAGVRYPSAVHYSEQARYYDAVNRFVTEFPADQLYITTNEALRADNASVVRELYGFLGVDDSFVPEMGEVHGSKAPRFRLANKVLNAPAVRNTAHAVLPGSLYVRLSGAAHSVTLKSQRREELSDEVRARIEAQCRDDVDRTGALIGRDLLTEWGFSEA